MQAEARPAFEEGTALIFSRWTALELAVENEWGGRSSRQKADELIAEALEWFYGRRGDDLPPCPKSQWTSFQLRAGRMLAVRPAVWPACSHVSCMHTA